MATSGDFHMAIDNRVYGQADLVQPLSGMERRWPSLAMLRPALALRVQKQWRSCDRTFHRDRFRWPTAIGHERASGDGNSRIASRTISGKGELAEPRSDGSSAERGWRGPLDTPLLPVLQPAGPPYSYAKMAGSPPQTESEPRGTGPSPMYIGP